MAPNDAGLRRRADDLKLDPENSEDIYPNERRSHARARSRTPGRSFLRRFRQPIIGLSIAGAAAPLINAGADDASRRPVNNAQPTEAELARQAAGRPAGKKADAEDQIAARIAEEHQGSQREMMVGEAMTKFDIDQKLASDIYDIAQQEGIEPELAYGLVKTESSFKTHARSGVGARGLTQVMPKTAKWMMPGTKAEDLYDQRTNLKLGFRYLNQMIDKYRGNVRDALHAYNRGPGTVDRILKRGGDPANGYADKVMSGWKKST